MSRRPPSQRDPQYVGARIDRALAQRIPGIGRLTNSSPVRDDVRTAARATASSTLLSSAVVFRRDRFAIAVVPATLTLTYLPMPDSAHVYVNGLEQDEGADYTIDQATLTLTAGMVAVGDVVDVRYASLKGLPAALPPDVYSGLFIGSGSVSNGSFATSQTVFVSGAVAVGDLLVAFTRASGGAPLPPAGWTAVRSDLNTALFGYAEIYKRTATSADVASPTYTWTGPTDNWTVAVLAYRGPTTVAAHAGLIDQGSAASIDAPSVTAPADGGILVCSWSYNINGFGPTGTPRLNLSSGMTRRTMALANGWVDCEQQELIVPAGATGVRTATTVSGSSVPFKIGQSVVLA